VQARTRCRCGATGHGVLLNPVPDVPVAACVIVLRVGVMSALQAPGPPEAPGSITCPQPCRFDAAQAD